MSQITRSLAQIMLVVSLALSCVTDATAQEPSNTAAKRDSAPRARRSNWGIPKRPPVPAGVRKLVDLEYARVGEHPLLLDLYLPEQSASPLPVIVWIHGGGWRSGTKQDCPALPLAGDGYAVASLDYRLSHEAKFPAQIQDCKAAVRWLRANAKRYNLDPDRFGAWGSSAGGHLVALLATANVPEWDKLGGNTEYSSRVQAACDWFGPTDLMLIGKMVDGSNARQAVRRLLGGQVDDLPDAAKLASPINHVSDSIPPILIMHGDADDVVPLEHGQKFAEKLRGSGADVELIVIQGGIHGFRGIDREKLFPPVHRFFDSHLKPQGNADQ